MPYAQSAFEAEEITNDGFMKVFRKIKDYDPKYPIEAWIRRIMINTAIDFYRANKKHYYALDVTEMNEEDTQVGVIDKMAEEDIVREVQDLPPAYRVAFTLSVIEGYKHHEIAEKLGITEGTSKSNLAKAKAKLKSAILKNQKRN